MISKIEQSQLPYVRTRRYLSITNECQWDDSCQLPKLAVTIPGNFLFIHLTLGDWAGRMLRGCVCVCVHARTRACKVTHFVASIPSFLSSGFLLSPARLCLLFHAASKLRIQCIQENEAAEGSQV